MRSRKFIGGVALSLGLSAAMSTAGVSAAALDGKKNLICAASHVVACTEGKCLEGPAKTFDLLNFISVDFTRKLVHGVDAKGAEVSSPVKNQEITKNAIILQGFENHRGWTMAINRNDRELTMSSIGAEVNFIITGFCTER